MGHANLLGAGWEGGGRLGGRKEWGGREGAALSAPVSDSSGGRQGEKEGRTGSTKGALAGSSGIESKKLVLITLEFF